MNPWTWIKGHMLLVGLTGAAVTGYVLYSYTHRSSSAGTASTISGGAATTGSPQYLVPVVQNSNPPTAPSAPAPVVTTTTPPPATTTTKPTGEQGLRLVGAGYYSTNNPGGYVPIASGATYEALLKAKTPVFYQPAPGIFQPLPTAIEGNILKPGPYGNTPVFIK